MHRAGFEPAIPVFERSQTVRALDRADVGTGLKETYLTVIYCPVMHWTADWTATLNSENTKRFVIVHCSCFVVFFEGYSMCSGRKICRRTYIKVLRDRNVEGVYSSH